ncbi:MAG: TetR/AcrR family transcriptional regulator [Cytophagales bacterium]|nr:MAG: TetR/AcrR family transcriptional regulator [Cytophagales bacterium]
MNVQYICSMETSEQNSSKKEEIIKKAFSIFVNKGYYETSISDLAEACSVPNALFYYYFKNKEGLMVEVLKYTQTYSETRFAKLIEEPNLNPKQKLEALAAFFEKYYSAYQGGCIMGNTLGTAFTEEQFLPIIKRFFEVWINALQNLFMVQYQPEKAQELAEATIQDIEGGILLMKLYRDKKYLDKALKRMTKLID